MSQFDFGNLESPLSGTVFINGNLEPWRDALHSGHSGDTRPSYAVGGMTWIDTTTNPWIEKLFDGSEDIIKGYIDTTTNTYTPAGVSQAAEDISFDNTDSGLTATNVQDAVDEAYGDYDAFANRAAGFATEAQGAKADTALQPVDIKKFLHLQDQKASGTSGGTFTSGAWRTRDLNVELEDTIGSTLSSNQFTLPAGTYQVNCRAPAIACTSAQARLQNITDGTTELLGGNVFISTNDGGVSFLTGNLTVVGTKTFELQHRCSTTRNTDGFGQAQSWGTEVYSDVVIQKIG